MSALSYLNNFSGLESRVSPKIQDSKLKKTAQRLSDQFGFTVSEAPHFLDIKLVYEKLVKILNHELDFRIITKREYRLVPWALIQPCDENSPLFEQAGAISNIFVWIEQKNKIEIFSPFIHVFLYEYPNSSSQFETLRQSLLNYIVKNQHHKLKPVKGWIEQTGLLQHDAPDLTVNRILSEGLQASFSELKLINGLQFGKFALISLQRLFTLLSAELAGYEQSTKRKLTDGLLKLLVNGDTLTYPTLRIDIADGLLQSFQSQRPTDYEKNKLKDFFLQLYGDPRASKGSWVGVSEEAIEVLKSWMVEDTMLDFFKLLSNVAKTDFTADKHWHYRKRFWNAYLKKGYVQEAWVALGPFAQLHANTYIKGGANTYAALSGGNNRHSALIMVIGDLLITEWSHSGKYRVWDNKAEGPQLYNKTYTREHLISYCDHDGSHVGSDAGAWQSNLSSLINNLTGLQVNEWEYMNE
jgi:hypothetical protein